MENQENVSYVPYKMNEDEKQRMLAFLELVGDRIEVLKILDTYAYFFPDWQKTVSEALILLIDKQQELKITCDNEKEVLTNINFFFSKMAYYHSLISDWQNEMAIGKEVNEDMLGKM